MTEQQAPPLCSKCKDRPASKGMATCKPCRKGATTAGKLRRARLRAAGLCTRCGIEPPEAEKQTCVDCTEVDRIRHERRIADGKCTWHGRPIAPGYKTYCADCVAYHRERHAREKAQRAALRAQALAQVAAEAEAAEQGVAQMGKRNPNKTPPEGSFAAWVCAQPVGIDQDQLAQMARAAGFEGANGKRVYHARWYYGLIPQRVTVRASELKPLAVLSGEVQAPVSEELVAAVLKHGTHAARAVIEAIEARGATRAPAPPVHQPLGKKVSA